MKKNDKTIIKEKKEPPFSPSKEIGHVNKDGEVRESRPFGSEQVGKIKDGEVFMDRNFPKGIKDIGSRPISRIEEKVLYGADKPFFSTEYPYGFVDEKGNVWRNSCGYLYEKKIIGQVRGNNPERALAYYSIQFRKIVEQYERLERDTGNTKEYEKPKALYQVQNMLKWVPEAQALGDFDFVISGLKTLEKRLLEGLKENLEKKERLLHNLENISTENWKEAGEKVKEIQEEWKGAGPVPREKMDINEQYKKALDKFYSRRNEFFERLNKERGENLFRKRELISRLENVSIDNYKTANEEVMRIQKSWKETGPVPKENFEEINGGYKKLLNRFYEERKEFFERLNEERKENLEKRRGIVESVKDVDTEDLKEASEILKGLIADWKSSGPVPKDEWGSINQEFKDALDDKYSTMGQTYEDRQRDWENSHSD